MEFFLEVWEENQVVSSYCKKHSHRFSETWKMCVNLYSYIIKTVLLNCLVICWSLELGTGHQWSSVRATDVGGLFYPPPRHNPVPRDLALRHFLTSCVDTINRCPVELYFYNIIDVDGVSLTHTWAERENRRW